MEFGIKSEAYHYGGDLYECIDFMNGMSIMKSTNANDSGFVSSMLSLPLNESVETIDSVGRMITITRIK